MWNNDIHTKICTYTSIYVDRRSGLNVVNKNCSCHQTGAKINMGSEVVLKMPEHIIRTFRNHSHTHTHTLTTNTRKQQLHPLEQIHKPMTNISPKNRCWLLKKKSAQEVVSQLFVHTLSLFLSLSLSLSLSFSLSLSLSLFLSLGLSLFPYPLFCMFCSPLSFPDAHTLAISLTTITGHCRCDGTCVCACVCVCACFSLLHIIGHFLM